ncbi:MAG: 3-keto-5-aminohexanoate cleavage protein [Oscillospiraceae bacterium]|nr:3-keto-5-aminohexanoate cleavage protein [Oscillospiraceae bacterium]
MNQKLIITAALLGNGTTKEMNPAVPYTPEEIARDAVACVKAGASIIHIHVRDDEGHASMETHRFAEAHSAVVDALEREGLDAILNLSTGGVGSDELRTAHIETIKPEMCSYNPGSINWGKAFVYLNPPSLMERLGKVCQETGTKPEIEIFDTAMFNNVRQCVKDGILTAPCHFQFIMGIPGGMEGTMKNVSFLLDCMPEGSTWSITGIGRWHMPMLLAGLAGGANGIRVGLEDGIWLKKGVLATNESYVRQAVELGKTAGRDIATAEEAREILGVKRR